MVPLFANRPTDRLGLALFLNAGDPPLNLLAELLLLFDRTQVDCLELAVPFPDSVTDGPVIRRSARRALAEGIDLDVVTDFLSANRPRLKHTKVVLLADWNHTVRASTVQDFLCQTRDAGADGVLIHGIPPRLRPGYYEAAERIGQAVVTTCYSDSSDDVRTDAAAHAAAYLYLVARYGRSGTTPGPDPIRLGPVISRLRELTVVPIAVGFGVRDATHLDAVRRAGADAAVVGSALVACVERALAQDRDVLADVSEYLRRLHPSLMSPDQPRKHIRYLEESR